MRSLAILIASALILGGCDGAASEPAKPKTPSPADLLRAEEAKVVELVKAQLKDPDSAQFRNVRRMPFMGMPSDAVSKVYCGQVNARNSFGGYSGYSDFVAQPDRSEAYVVEGDDHAARFEYTVLCLEDGKPRPGKEVTLGS